MIPNLQNILKEWSYRVGVIKPNEEKHLFQLHRILVDEGWPLGVINEVIQSLTEAKADVVAPTLKQAREKAKKGQTYSSPRSNQVYTRGKEKDGEEQETEKSTSKEFKSDIDNFYKIGKAKFSKDVPQYSRTTRSRFSKIINLLANVVNNFKPQKNALAQFQFWGMLLVCEHIVDNNYEISDYQSLASLIINTNTRLSVESSVQFSSDMTSAEEQGEELPNRSRYYFHFQSNFKSKNDRNHRRRLLIPAVISSDEFKDLLDVSEEEIA